MLHLLASVLFAASFGSCELPAGENVLTQARFLPVYEREALVGIRLNGIRSRSYLACLRLRDEDVVIANNGDRIDSNAASAEFLKRLTSGKLRSLEVRRGDRVVTLD